MSSDRLTHCERDRRRIRDIIAEASQDEDGLPQYDFADYIIGQLHREGFEIGRHVERMAADG